MPDKSQPVVPTPRPIGEILADMFHRPGEHILKKWNWKSALMSSLLRASIFFSVNLFASFRAAVAALVTEFVFRPLVSGFYGGLTESFRATSPSWTGTMAVIVILPAVNHVVELTIHWARGTQKLGASIAVSVSFSVLSGLFNMFAMRRNILITGEGRRPFLEDMKRVPLVLAAFLAAGPLAVWRFTVARYGRP